MLTNHDAVKSLSKLDFHLHTLAYLPRVELLWGVSANGRQTPLLNTRCVPTVHTDSQRLTPG
jgi:hypothetical protein